MPVSNEPNSIENIDELTPELIEKKKADLESKINNLHNTYQLALEAVGKVSNKPEVIERQKEKNKGIETQIKNYEAQLVAINFKLSLPEDFRTFDRLCEFVKADEPETRIGSYKEALDLLNSIESSAQEFNLARVLTKVKNQKLHLEELLKMKK